VIDPQSLLGTPILNPPLPLKSKQILLSVLCLHVLKRHLRTTPFLRFEPPHLLRVEKRSRLKRHRHSNHTDNKEEGGGVSEKRCWGCWVICAWGVDCDKNSVCCGRVGEAAIVFAEVVCVGVLGFGSSESSKNFAGSTPAQITVRCVHK
jgi:hypothetical protein